MALDAALRALAFSAGRKQELERPRSGRELDHGNARNVTAPAGKFDTLPVRYDARFISHDRGQQLVWHNVETLYYPPAASQFVRADHMITGTDGAATRDSVTGLLEYRRG